MRRPDKLNNVRTVYMNGESLCVQCRACGRKALVHYTALLERRDVDQMTPLNRLKFRCAECDSHDVDLLIPITEEEAQQWLKSGAGEGDGSL